jgi:hypothetical protein
MYNHAVVTRICVCGLKEADKELGEKMWSDYTTAFLGVENSIKSGVVGTREISGAYKSLYEVFMSEIAEWCETRKISRYISM